MDELLGTLSIPAGTAGWIAVLVNVGVAFLLGLFIVAIYGTTHRQMVVSFSFVITLILICMIMSMVIMVIGDNIARAFGLAGAMSIVRFRTVVKDTRDTAFVFYAIAAGMAAGTGNVRLAVLGTPMIGLLLIILHWTWRGNSIREVHLLNFESEVGAASGQEAHMEVFRRHLENWNLVSTRSVRAGTGIQYTFQVRLRSTERPQDLIRDLSALEGVLRAQLSLGDELEP